MKNKNSVSKSFLYALIGVVLLSSCNRSWDEEACLNSVKELFPNSKIYTGAGGSINNFIVVDSVNIYKVYTSNPLSPEVTTIVPLFLQNE